MKTLLELFKKYNNYENVDYPSDKNSYHSYIEDVYEEYFSTYRNEKINLLEIGVAHSGSIRLWNDYFKDAQIYGIDNFSCGEEIKNKSEDLIDGKLKNVKIICDDAYAENISGKLPDFDIIIDDGPHTYESQILAIRYYLPKLKPGGYMFVEDIPIDWDYDLYDDDLQNHPWMVGLINEILKGYHYKILDLRRSPNLVTTSERGDNVVLVIYNPKD